MVVFCVAFSLFDRFFAVFGHYLPIMPLFLLVLFLINFGLVGKHWDGALLLFCVIVLSLAQLPAVLPTASGRRYRRINVAARSPSRSGPVAARSPRRRPATRLRLAATRGLLIKFVRIASGRRPTTTQEDGRAFEEQCCAILSRNGWRAELTGGSGDQGADIIARKSGRILVIQCKYYSRAVSNGAVQEVSAAKAYYRATDAVVVTNASYTRSAIALARATGVVLLHYSDLRRL